MGFFKLVAPSRASRIRNLCDLFCTQLSKTFLLSITLGPFGTQDNYILLIFKIFSVRFWIEVASVLF